jgi:ATP phosphoribosyltransferase
MEENGIRISLPSKGRLAEEALELLADAGLRVYKPNPRQYMAKIPSLPELTVIFQRPGDIVVSVRDGSVDFGITGWDMYSELRGDNGLTLPLHAKLGFGTCTLNVIVPENWESINELADLKALAARENTTLRVATKFPNLTRKFFTENGLENIELIFAEGTLEIAPTVGYADLIVDLVSTGTTLRDNRLKVLEGGQIIKSQACLIANKASLKTNPKALAIARQLLEFIVAHLRAMENLSVFANIRSDSPEQIADALFSKKVIGGLQGPTLSPVITRDRENWYAVHLVVRKDQMAQAIAELREIGGSGLIVAPVRYIFEEEPQEFKAMLAALEE